MGWCWATGEYVSHRLNVSQQLTANIFLNGWSSPTWPATATPASDTAALGEQTRTPSSDEARSR
ncbi:hypothetical protein BN126340090 [Stenotrophomonas thermophila]|nr:hypothetical protein BN126340090 [Stenotrophomonas maltophilia]